MTEEAEVLADDSSIESNEVAETVEAESVNTEQPMSGEPTGENPDSNQPLFSEEGQRLFNTKMAEEKRAKRELEARLKDLESKVPQESRPDIPDIPDPYSFDTDDGYKDAIRKRDEALSRAVSYDTRQRSIAEQQQRQQQEEAIKQQIELENAVTTYSSRAAKLGVSQDELQAAGQQIENYGVNLEVQKFILRDDSGPLITKYLAANPLELDAIRSLDPVSAAVKIATEIKPKASTLRPKTTSAPPPIETFNGAGQSEKFEGPEGATFE
jgi:hypothetical protein